MSFTLPIDSAPTFALALHTASPDFGLAIDNFAGNRRSQTWDLGRDLSTHLHVYLQEFLQPQTWHDLMFLAVAKGPGGFTGTRIGVVTARTIAQQLNLPLFPISTLAAAAWANRPTFRNDASQLVDGVGGVDEVDSSPAPLPPAPCPPAPIDLAIEMPAQRGEVHTAIYTVSPTAPGLQVTMADCVQAIDSWQNFLDSRERPYKLIKLEGGLGATAPALLELAHQEWKRGDRTHWSEVVPFYGQSPVKESQR